MQSVIWLHHHIQIISIAVSETNYFYALSYYQRLIYNYHVVKS